MPCSRIQRRRARATSKRFCSTAYRVFFIADIVTFKKPPNRTSAARDPSLLHSYDDLIKRKVRLLAYQSQQKFRVIFQRRCTAAAGLGRNTPGLFESLRPNHHDAGADPVAFGRFAPRRSSQNIFNYSGTQVARVSLRIDFSWKIESMTTDSLIDEPLGIPPIQPERNML